MAVFYPFNICFFKLFNRYLLVYCTFSNISLLQVQRTRLQVTQNFTTTLSHSYIILLLFQGALLCSRSPGKNLSSRITIVSLKHLVKIFNSLYLLTVMFEEHVHCTCTCKWYYSCQDLHRSWSRSLKLLQDYNIFYGSIFTRSKGFQESFNNHWKILLFF